MTDQTITWLDKFRREASIRKSLILHGNINDVYPTSQGCLAVPELLTAELARLGYNRVARWDAHQGVQNLNADQLNELQNQCLSTEVEDNASGSDYDFGPENNDQSLPQTGNTPADPADFFSLIFHQLTDNQSQATAFIIDFSHLLFGNANNLSDKERHLILMLGKAMRDAHMPQQLADMKKQDNLIVFICPKAGSLPPILTANNPLVATVNLPRPSRNQRQLFLEKNSALFSTMPPISPGDRHFQDFIDSQDGFSYRDCLQLARLSRNQSSPLSSEKLVNLYKFGEKTSPWEELSREKLLRCRDELKAWVKGQDEAIEKVNDMILKAYSGLSGIQHSSQQTTPKGVLFFVGPTGVGKTELAKSIARFLFGDENACLRFDMSEFNHEQSDQRLVGAPPGYVGYEEGGQLTNAIRNKPFSVILFDEIEKAHGRILDKFLQILEDGRLTDGKGDTVSFAESVIIFTSNIGAAEVDHTLDNQSVRKQFIAKVEDHFKKKLARPELLGRIGSNIIPFNFIAGEDFRLAIAEAKLKPLKKRLQEKYGIRDLIFRDKEKALQTIIRQASTESGGRDILNVIDRYLITPLASYLALEIEDSRDSQGRDLLIIQAGNSHQFVFDLD